MATRAARRFHCMRSGQRAGLGYESRGWVHELVRPQARGSDATPTLTRLPGGWARPFRRERVS